MGDWNITIKGVGAHHNKDYDKDANKMAADFVARLKAAGHAVTHASFTHGGADDISDPDKYLEERKRYEQGG